MIKRALLGCAAALFVLAAHCEANDAADVKKAVEAALGKGTNVAGVRDAGFLGLYEVLADGEIYYTDRKVTYLIDGDVVELKSRKNLTQERKSKLAQIKFSDLPLDLAIKQVRGNGKRVFATFEDPNCGYCKRLAKELQSMNDVTFYTFLFPILSSDSVEKSKSIWCAPDKAKAWNDWMINNVEPPAAKCDAPTDKVIALGRKLAIRGTPTIFFSDGSRVPGYMPTAQLDQALNKAAQTP